MEALDLLLLDGEDEGVVSAAMAFIEAVEVDDAKNSSASSDESISSSVSQPIRPALKKTARRKRKTKPDYSTEQGRRKKAEVLSLRTEVQGLEGWVEHLKRSKSETKRGKNTRSGLGQTPIPTRTSQQTAAMAMAEFQKVQQSENTNQELKAILANQEKVGTLILAMIQQTSTFKGVEFVFNCPRPIPVTFENAAVIAQLRDGARFLYLDQSSVVPQQSSDAYSCVMTPKDHPNCGKMFESSTVCSVHVPCSTKTGSDVLWLEYSTPGNYKGKSYRFMKPAGPKAVKKNFAAFQERFDANERFDVRQQARRLQPNHNSPRLYRIPAHSWCSLESDAGFSAAPKDPEYQDAPVLAVAADSM